MAEGSLDAELLKTTYTNIGKLDSEHGLFYSIRTAYCMSEFRDEINAAIQVFREGAPLSEQQLDKLRTAGSLAEIGLKKDVGILIDELQFIRQESSSQNDYRDVVPGKYSS